jgi:YHS domain-containing protein
MKYAHNTPGLNGYDPVAYHTEAKPVKGNGWNVAEHNGITYLFANEKNRKMFENDPEKFLPAFGGFCAYGVALGKKFASDPEVWRIENGKLFLNLDADIQKKWEKDLRGYIQKADANWPQIKEKAPADL